MIGCTHEQVTRMVKLGLEAPCEGGIPEGLEGPARQPSFTILVGREKQCHV